MTRDNAHDPRAIANLILEICKTKGRPLTLMQIIKLVYLADGWSLALLEKPLSKHAPQAWQYGPVFPTVYRAFKRFQSKPIDSPAADSTTGVMVSERFDDSEIALVKQVVDSYGKYHAFQLSEMMHKPGTPWTETFTKSGPYAEIPIDLMAKHFGEIRDQRGVTRT